MIKKYNLPDPQKKSFLDREKKNFVRSILMF